MTLIIWSNGESFRKNVLMSKTSWTHLKSDRENVTSPRRLGFILKLRFRIYSWNVSSSEMIIAAQRERNKTSQVQRSVWSCLNYKPFNFHKYAFEMLVKSLWDWRCVAVCRRPRRASVPTASDHRPARGGPWGSSVTYPCFTHFNHWPSNGIHGLLKVSVIQFARRCELLMIF